MGVWQRDEVGFSDSGLAGRKMVDLIGLCLKFGGVGGI